MDGSPRRRWLHVLWAYVLLPHAVPILVVMGATASLAMIAAQGSPGTGAFARLLGAMLGGQVAIGAVNELADSELDRRAKPHKPIPAGLVSKRGARLMAIIGAAGMLALSTTFGARSLLLCVLGTSLGIAYSLWFKRTVWSWLPYALALPLLPIWVWSALATVDGRLWMVYPVGLPAVLAVQLAQSLPDVEGDRRTGVRTLAVALGEVRARRLCWGGLVVAAALAAGFAPAMTPEPAWVWAAAACACALIALNALAWLHDARRGVMTCFPCVATGVAVLGIGWAVAIAGG